MKRASKILALLLIMSLILVSTGCSAMGEKEYNRKEFLMDTLMQITVYGQDEVKMKGAVDAAFEEFKRVGALTDRFAKPGTPAYSKSDVCRVNEGAGKKAVAVGVDVSRMVEIALDYNQKSGGAFNITIGPVMDLWGFPGDNPKVPSKSALNEKLKLVDIHALTYDKQNHTVFLQKPGMIMDLGGIAKGYAANRAAQILSEKGIQKALINAGGNVVTLGNKEGSTPWKVGIQDPRSPQDLVAIVQLGDHQTAVTSGDYQRNFTENGVLYHHILDPKTGEPARGAMSVSVITNDKVQADGLTTSLFVLGQKKGLEFIKQFPGVEVIYINSDKTVVTSPGLKGRVEVPSARGYKLMPQ